MLHKSFRSVIIQEGNKKQKFCFRKTYKILPFTNENFFTKNVSFFIFYWETGSTVVLPSLVRSFKRLPLTGLFSPLTQLQNILKKIEVKCNIDIYHDSFY